MEGVVGKLKSSLVSRQKRLLISIAILALLIVVGWLIYKHLQRPQNCLSSKTPSCTVLRSSAQYLDGDHQVQLKGEVDQIKSIKDYQKNANLMYVLTIYYFNQRDTQNTQTNFDQLKKVYNDKIGYDPTLSGRALTMDQLSKTIDYIKQYQDQGTGIGGKPSGR